MADTEPAMVGIEFVEAHLKLNATAADAEPTSWDSGPEATRALGEPGTGPLPRLPDGNHGEQAQRGGAAGHDPEGQEEGQEGQEKEEVNAKGAAPLSPRRNI